MLLNMYETAHYMLLVFLVNRVFNNEYCGIYEYINMDDIYQLYKQYEYYSYTKQKLISYVKQKQVCLYVSKINM